MADTNTIPISTKELVDMVKLSVITIDGYVVDAFNIQELIAQRLLASDAWAQNYGSAMMRIQELEEQCQVNQ